jgi:hypothetical protein
VWNASADNKTSGATDPVQAAHEASQHALASHEGEVDAVPQAQRRKAMMDEDNGLDVRR